MLALDHARELAHAAVRRITRQQRGADDARPGIQRRLKPSASTLPFAAGKVPLRTLDDARAGDGLTHDITGTQASSRGLLVPQRTPEEAARVFWRVAEGMDFTFFEHYLADEAGHAQDFTAAFDALDTFDASARAVVASRPPDARGLICSDHGNVEDLSTPFWIPQQQRQCGMMGHAAMA